MNAPPATPDDLKTMKNENSPLKSESMSAAAEPVHQGEQQTGDNKRDEDADTPAESW